MIRAAFILPALVALTACEDPKKAVLFDGQRYAGRTQVDSEDKRRFVATAGPVSQGLDGAREAARYEGTTYCIRRYGRSDIAWTIDPDSETPQVVDDQLTVQGRCSE